jgi:ATP-dependent Clp protease ATP-binding subunit ClpB
MVQDPLATKLLRGEFKAGDHVVVDEGPDGSIAFRKGERALEGEVVVH